jgi:ABC-type Mn2+/Zn2+ transport system ATPase subunit
MACLSEVRLDRFAERRIGELSAGKRRLALLARALVNEPEVLLLDEPLQGLDARTEADLFRLLERLRQRGMVVVVATRDLACVPDRFQHAVLLNGQVIAQGRPAEVLTQAHLQATYGSHLVSMRVDAGQFAVDAGPHQR